MLEGKKLFYRHRPETSWMLNCLNIVIQPGEVIGISGPSGCGKSTLAQILAGYLKPQIGSVSVDRQPLPARGYCPVQLLFQHPELTVNPCWKVSRIIAEAHPPSPELLHQLDISPQWMARWPHELSGGEIQRVAVARVLADPRTRYLIADETTAMLDAQTQARIWHMILAHCRLRQIGILVISHDHELLNCICSSILEVFNSE